MMPKNLFLGLAFLLTVCSLNAQDFHIRVDDGICKFSGVKIGDKKSKIERIYGEITLEIEHTSGLSSLYFPNNGLEFILEGEAVKEIQLYPKGGVEMGKYKSFEIFSRNSKNWTFDNLELKEAFPQDVLAEFGTDITTNNHSSSYSSRRTLSGGKPYMSYNLINAGGEQKLTFYFSSGDPQVLLEIRNSLK